MSRKPSSRHPTARQQLGAQGETLAARALVAAGYRIVATDVRVAGGQIDLLTEEGGDLVFVEVKTRRTATFGTPLEAITPAKRRHMVTAAQAYLAEHELLDRPWRIDVVAISLEHAAPQIEIVRHAVGEE
jgi:putative endonuclease